MTQRCTKCKNAITMVGAYTGTGYIECRFEKEIAEKATDAELLGWIKNPATRPTEKDYCQYKSGKPVNGGVTFDD